MWLLRCSWWKKSKLLKNSVPKTIHITSVWSFLDPDWHKILSIIPTLFKGSMFDDVETHWYDQGIKTGFIASLVISYKLVYELTNNSQASALSNRNGNGENLNIFKDWSLKSDAAYIRQAIVSWYSQKGAYDVNTPTSAPQYTQVLQILYI